MSRSRRWFLKSAATFGAGIAGVRLASAGSPRGPRRITLESFGRLVPDPAGIVDLPEGFTYTVLSRMGDDMDDGLIVPGLHDGMAAFPGASGKTVLVRNHEVLTGANGAFGHDHELLERVDPAKVFDAGYGKTPSLGGTTTLVFDTGTQELQQHFLSLAGTTRNCSGGPTPWGSWVTCEEFPQRANDVHEMDHGWCFEVPSSATELVDPVPLTWMGRFNHEAIAVDPESGVVYLTEDQADGLLYRYVPDVAGDLAQGGRLQALAIKNAPASTRATGPPSRGSDRAKSWRCAGSTSKTSSRPRRTCASAVS